MQERRRRFIKSKASQRPNGRKIPHSHPGEILQEIVLPDTGWSVSEMARRLGISRQSLSRILAAERPVTPEIVVCIGALFGSSPEMWLRLQAAYDLWETHNNLRQAQKNLRGEVRHLNAVGKKILSRTNEEHRQAAYCRLQNQPGLPQGRPF